MSFLFGLFRFLTWGNIMVVGFFLLFVLMAMFLAPSPLGVLPTLFFLGFVMYHNLLSTQLQRSISSPEVPVPQSLPRTILLSGIVSFIYAILVAVNLIIFSKLGQDEMMKMMNTQNIKDADKAMVEQMMTGVRGAVLVLGSIHAIAIAGNCELSRIFFNRWRKEKQAKEAEAENDYFDINNP